VSNIEPFKLKREEKVPVKDEEQRNEKLNNKKPNNHAKMSQKKINGSLKTKCIGQGEAEGGAKGRAW